MFLSPIQRFVVFKSMAKTSLGLDFWKYGLYCKIYKGDPQSFKQGEGTGGGDTNNLIL